MHPPVLKIIAFTHKNTSIQCLCLDCIIGHVWTELAAAPFPPHWPACTWPRPAAAAPAGSAGAERSERMATGHAGGGGGQAGGGTGRFPNHAGLIEEGGCNA